GGGGGGLDVDHVLVRGVDVQPVVTGDAGAGGVGLDAGVVREVDDVAVVDDLQRGVVVHLGVLEVVAWHAGDGGRPRPRPVVINDCDDHRDDEQTENAADHDRQQRHAGAAPATNRGPAGRLALA